jgi:hypothetical protein
MVLEPVVETVVHAEESSMAEMFEVLGTHVEDTTKIKLI